jgi:hypothetical protein
MTCHTIHPTLIKTINPVVSANNFGASARLPSGKVRVHSPRLINVMAGIVEKRIVSAPKSSCIPGHQGGVQPDKAKPSINAAVTAKTWKNRPN